MSQVEKRQRIRLVKSCRNCRKRKVKCDQQKPVCASCNRKNIKCVYEEQEWSMSSSATKTIISTPSNVLNSHSNIKVKQYKPKSFVNSKNLDNEEIDFYSHTFASPIRFSQGPLTWVSMLRKDRFMNAIVLSQRIREATKNERMEDFTHAEFIQKWNKGISKLINGKLHEFKEVDLMQEIEYNLRNSKLVWISVDKFFDSEYYLFFPYLDKEEFISKLTTLIGPPTYIEVPVSLKLTKIVDLSIIGTLLIVINLIATSTYNFGKPLLNSNQMIDQYITDNSTSSSILKILDKIHQVVSTITIPSLQIFQFVCLKLCFQLFSPEEYDCLHIADSAKLGELIQYATQCSLNRDPDVKNTSLLPATKKNKNLSRRLWYQVVFFDILKFISSGYATLIDPAFYDTKLPQDIDSPDSEIELIVNNWIVERMEMFIKMKPTLKMILDINEKPTVGRIKKALEPFVEATRNSESMDVIMARPCDTLIDRCLNFRKLLILLQSNSVLFTVYYHLFIFYSERDAVDQSVYYLVQLLKITKVFYKNLLFMDPNVEEFNLRKHFGSASLCFPKLEGSFHKISSLFFSILSRIKSLKISKRGDISHAVLVILDEMIDILNSAFSYIMTLYVNVSDIYYHTWMLSKVQVAINLKILRIPKGMFSSSDFTEEDINYKAALDETVGLADNTDLGFENYSIDDLTTILNELKGLKSVYHYKSRTLEEDILKTFNPDKLTEIDKKWIGRVLRENGHDLGNTDILKSPDEKNSEVSNDTIDNNIGLSNIDLFSSNLNEFPSDNISNIEDLNSLFTGSAYDDLFTFGVDNLFGLNHEKPSGWY